MAAVRVQQTDLPAGQKARCYRTLLFFAARHSPKMVRDLVIATEQGFNSLLGIAPEEQDSLNRASPQPTKQAS